MFSDGTRLKFTSAGPGSFYNALGRRQFNLMVTGSHYAKPGCLSR